MAADAPRKGSIVGPAGFDPLSADPTTPLVRTGRRTRAGGGVSGRSAGCTAAGRGRGDERHRRHGEEAHRRLAAATGPTQERVLQVRAWMVCRGPHPERGCRWAQSSGVAPAASTSRKPNFRISLILMG